MLKHNYNAINSDDPYNQTFFEILGFDIILDKNLKPWLLEVNHSPSFQTTSPLDLKVKSNLISDTFKLLNISETLKEKLINLQQENDDLRMRTGKRVKLNEGATREKCLNERDRYIHHNLGGFEMIYPPEDPFLQSKYDKILREAEQVYHKFTGAGTGSKLSGYDRMIRLSNR